MSTAPTGSIAPPWFATACAVTSGVSGLVIILLPGTPLLARLFGGVVIVCSALRAVLDRRSGHPVLHARPPAIEPKLAAPTLPAAAVATRGTAKDLQTAMQLFGAEIVGQVSGSVTTALTENSEMRQMAAELASASEQGKSHFKTAMLRSADAETGIASLNSLGNELNESIQVIAGDVKNSIEVVKQATTRADTTRNCVETMANLSRSVSEVVKMIDTIARQTRMLALNATIEAARAGDA